MSTIMTKDGTQIYYKDWGTGQAIVFSHEWPLNAGSWEAQMVFLASNGYRCIAHEHRRLARDPPGDGVGDQEAQLGGGRGQQQASPEDAEVERL